MIHSATWNDPVTSDVEEPSFFVTLIACAGSSAMFHLSAATVSIGVPAASTTCVSSAPRSSSSFKFLLGIWFSFSTMR